MICGRHENISLHKSSEKHDKKFYSKNNRSTLPVKVSSITHFYGVVRDVCQAIWETAVIIVWHKVIGKSEIVKVRTETVTSKRIRSSSSLWVATDAHSKVLVTIIDPSSLIDAGVNASDVFCGWLWINIQVKTWTCNAMLLIIRSNILKLTSRITNLNSRDCLISKF